MPAFVESSRCARWHGECQHVTPFDQTIKNQEVGPPHGGSCNRAYRHQQELRRVHANRDIHLEIARGTIHGIIGENGAGKSTLMSILYGFYQADSGEIRVGGKPTVIHTPNHAIAVGIGMVHQHFMLVRTSRFWRTSSSAPKASRC